MFTGIVTAIGEVVSHKGGAFAIRAAYPAETLTLGASIACDGCCLTVTGWQPEPAGVVFTVDVSNESLARTSLGGWQVGRHVNLERALKAGDELGGHIVTGHVDGVARLRALRRDGESRRLEIEAPDELAPYIASKGSVALDGTSLTVNEVDGSIFGVNLIPHTLTVTTWQFKRPGDILNLEIDLFARYVARLMESRR